MSLPHLDSDDIVRLRKIVEEGVRVKQEVKDLNDSLRDTIKDLAAELEVPVKTINKAIAIEFNDNLKDVQEEQTEVEELLEKIETNRKNP